MTDERTFAKKLTTKLDTAKFRGIYRGVIGWDQGDGTVLLRSSDLRANEVYVTFNDDTRQVVTALCLKVKRSVGINVLVERNVDGRWEVRGIDNEPAMQMFGEAAPDLNVPDSASPSLDKSIRSTFNLKEGRGRPLDNASMFVYIEPFHFDDGYWPGGAIDLTSYRPATASTKAWVVVGLTTSTNTLTAFTGTEHSLAVTMDESLIPGDTTITAGVISLWAWVLANGQTTITPQTQNADVRYWLAAAGGGATDTNAIHKNVSAEISTITEKTITANADLLIIEDSAASNAKKRVKAENFRGRINSLTLVGW